MRTADEIEQWFIMHTAYGSRHPDGPGRKAICARLQSFLGEAGPEPVNAKWIKFSDETPDIGRKIWIRYHGGEYGISVNIYRDGLIVENCHWFPVPPDPKEDWEVAWEEFGAEHIITNPITDRQFFKAGFESGRKPCP